jgi:endonuclease/exonuclease/phosphatase family metal-dependent hydrolase
VRCRPAVLLPIAALLVVPCAAGAWELRVLSYNTRGLPAWIAGDDPARRLPRIAALTARYDVTLLQEDFAHHDALRAAAPQPVVRRGNGGWCRLCGGSGLTLLLDLRRAALGRLWNGAYRGCAGWLGSGSDCLAAKGFQIAELEMDDGVVVHLVNTHLDAGASAADRAVRRSQLRELARAIARRVADGPLILGGDLNLHRASPADAALLREFAGRLGLEDTGARGRADLWRSHVDYILVRGGRGLRFHVLARGEDASFVAGGRPLSDHPALFATLAVRREP